MSSLLAAVTKAAHKRNVSDQEYRAAITEARAAGHTLEEIGRAAGLTKQGVRYLLFPDPRKERKP